MLFLHKSQFTYIFRFVLVCASVYFFSGDFSLHFFFCSFVFIWWNNMQNTFYPMLKGIDFVYVLWSLRYHTIYAIRTILYHHRMPLNRMEWHQIESNGMECALWNYPPCIFVQLPVSHSTKTFKLNRLFGYLSHHRICTMFMFIECVCQCACVFSLQIHFVCVLCVFFVSLSFRRLLGVLTVEGRIWRNKLSVNSRWHFIHSNTKTILYRFQF